MASVETWSTTASSNDAAPPDGFPEGQTPASLNNSARELMAALATFVRQLPWVKLTTGLTLVRNSATQFQLSGTDVTSIFPVGRRLREIGATTVYGSVASSSFTGGNTLVNVTNDASADIPTSLTAVDVAASDLLSIPPALAQASTTPNTPGTLRWSAAASPEADELACNGAAVSRTTYAVLFAKIGTAYGAGDGSTTFNVPDIRGRTLIGAGTGSGLTARTLGTQNIGAETVTLSTPEMPAHTHVGGLHTHDIPDANDTGDSSRLERSGTSNQGTTTTSSGGAVATTSTGGGAAHANMQPSVVGNVFIHI